MSTNDEIPNNEEVKLRMRKRFQNLENERRLKKESEAGWLMVLYIGFSIFFVGFIGLLIAIKVVIFSWELTLAVGTILVGVFFMVIAFHVRKTAEFYIEEQ